MDTPPQFYAHSRPSSSYSAAMPGGQPPSYGHHHHLQWQQPYPWQGYGPPGQHHPAYPQAPIPSLEQQQRPYATPATSSPFTDNAHNDQRERKPERHGTPALSQAGLSTNYDWAFLRQHILDTGEALMQVPCPTAFGPHNRGRYAVVTLLTQQTPERWRAGLVCDGQLVIEGPEDPYRQDAMYTLSEAIAARLAKSIPRVWEGEDAETSVEEHASGARFASESQ